MRISHRKLSRRFSVGTSNEELEERSEALLALPSCGCGRRRAVEGREAERPCAGSAVRGRAVAAPRRLGEAPGPKKVSLAQAWACCWYIRTGSLFLKPMPRLFARSFAVLTCV